MSKYRSRKFILTCSLFAISIPLLVLHFIDQGTWERVNIAALMSFCAVDYFEKKGEKQ